MASYNIDIHIDDRYHITELKYEDDRALFYHLNDKEIYNNTLQIPYPYYIEDAKNFIRNTQNVEFQTGKITNFALREGSALIGCLGILYNHGFHSNRTEIGYWIGADYRGQGIMSKAIPAFCTYIFENTDINIIEAQVFISNIPSQKLLEKCNFKKMGILRDAFMKDTDFIDVYFYQLQKPKTQF